MKKFYDRELEMQRLREMQRQAYEDCNPTRLHEKVEIMQRHLYRSKEIKMAGLSMEDM